MDPEVIAVKPNVLMGSHPSQYFYWIRYLKIYNKTYIKLNENRLFLKVY